MPTENEKILNALYANKPTGTENQKITELYVQTSQIDEVTKTSTAAGVAGGAATGAAIGTVFAPGVGTAIGAGIGAGVGLVGNVGAGGVNRLSLSMQKFLAGRGGGLSQMVGTVGSALGGSHYARFQAGHTQQDTEHWLWIQFQPLLQQNEGELTLKQVKDQLKTLSLDQEGGPTINPEQLPSMAQLKETDTFSEEQLKTLFQAIAPEIIAVSLTGTGAEANVEQLIRSIMVLPPAEQAKLFKEFAGGGLILAAKAPPKPEKEVPGRTAPIPAEVPATEPVAT